MHTSRLVVTLIAAFLSLPLSLAVLLTGRERLVEVYIEGGFFMLVVAVLILAQLALVALATGLEHRTPTPLVLHLIGPALVVLGGAAGTWLGMQKVISAIEVVDSADRGLIFFVGSSEAAVPLAYGLAAAGVGLMAVALSGLLACFSHATDPVGRGFGGALLVAVAGPLGLWSLGRAIVGMQLSEAHHALANADPAMRSLLYAASASDAIAVQLVMHVLVGVAFLVGLVLLLLRRSGSAAYLRGGVVGIVGGVLVAALAIAAVVGVGANERAMYERVRDSLRIELPALALPTVRDTGRMRAAAEPFATLESPITDDRVVTFALARSAAARDLVARATAAAKAGATEVYLLVIPEDRGERSPEMRAAMDAMEKVGAYPIPKPEALRLPLRIAALPGPGAKTLMRGTTADDIRGAKHLLIDEGATVQDLAAALAPLDYDAPALLMNAP